MPLREVAHCASSAAFIRRVVRPKARPISKERATTLGSGACATRELQGRHGIGVEVHDEVAAFGLRVERGRHPVRDAAVGVARENPVQVVQPSYGV